ncbi:Neurogenic protein big brain [Penaeus vannamei]|uniref:Neurogenic protein big brain n=1 Tax=Penaeus vannamei TaxID=6689 RepID=A0A423TQ02_PENVA|nr:Neurogenic protein big brain [Penaeus vannamei]
MQLLIISSFLFSSLFRHPQFLIISSSLLSPLFRHPQFPNSFPITFSPSLDFLSSCLLFPVFVRILVSCFAVYWVAPLLGGATAGLIYEYIFNPHRLPRSRKDSIDGEEGVESYPLNTVGGPGMHGGLGGHQSPTRMPFQYELQHEAQYDARLYRAYPPNNRA